MSVAYGIASADVSSCGTYRYTLRRTWQPGLPTLGWLLLNPSTADGEQDDPTIRKVIGFSQRAGYGSIVVVNLYALRATKPARLWEAVRQATREAATAKRAIGPRNDGEILTALKSCRAYVTAWGAHPRAESRAIEVARMLLGERVGPPLVIGLTKPQGRYGDRYPRHPVMAPYGPLLDWSEVSDSLPPRPGGRLPAWYGG